MVFPHIFGFSFRIDFIVMIVGERGEEEGEEPDSLTKQFEVKAFCLKTMHEFFKGIKDKVII